MAQYERLICPSEDLTEQGMGVRFPIKESVTGFAVRYKGMVHGYVNQCAHVPVELDWQEGEFFDLTRQYLICSTHGAHYNPETGYCVLGPCKGRRLQPLDMVERDGHVYLIETENNP